MPNPSSRKQEEPRGLYKVERQERKPFSERQKQARTPFFLGISKGFAGMGRSFGKNAKFSEAQQEAFSFLEWDVKAEDFRSAYFGILFLGFFITAIAGGFLYFFVFQGAIEQTLFFALGFMLFATILSGYYYLNYPKMAADKEKLLALAYVPEIVNYFTMSLRLTPNLEKAVEFAANHGQGKIAEELKKIVWDVQLGRYESVEEALDELAYKWGPYNDDFKQALMLVRASILEADSKKREDMLLKANSDVLEGAREKMDLYARGLQQPTVYLYYFGILLPLLLAILLPIAGAFANISFAKAEYLFVAYNILLPVLVFVFGSSILGSRPPTYVPPDVPTDHPGLPRRGNIRVGTVLLPAKTMGLLLFLLLMYTGIATDQGWTQNALNGILGNAQPGTEIIIPGTLGSVPDYLDPLSRQEAIAAIPHITYFDEHSLALGPIVLIGKGAFYGQFTIFAILFGFSAWISLWLLGEYWERKKVQDEIRGMEVEFQDALYVLASIEEALRSAVHFLPRSKVARTVFRRILENITLLGMTLDAAIFDKTFGVLKNLPSRTIASGLQFITDAVQLGVNVAAKSLISLSIQLRNAQKTDESLRRLLSDVTTMLKTMSVFVAPIVLGVVSAMQRIITNSLSSQASSQSTLPQLADSGVSGFSGLGSVFRGSDALKNSADPATFVLVMGLYVVEVVALLTYFNSQIEDTNNNLHTYVSIAFSLPVAVFIYCLVVFLSSSMLGGIVG